MIPFFVLISVESPNIFHWKSANKANFVWSFGQNLGQIRSSVVIKQRNRHFNSAANKYSPAGHHEKKNKETVGQIKYSAVTGKQQIKLVL